MLEIPVAKNHQDLVKLKNKKKEFRINMLLINNKNNNNKIAKTNCKSYF